MKLTTLLLCSLLSGCTAHSISTKVHVTVCVQCVNWIILHFINTSTPHFTQNHISILQPKRPTYFFIKWFTILYCVFYIKVEPSFHFYSLFDKLLSSKRSIFSIFSIMVLQEFCIYFAGAFKNHRKNRKISLYFSLLLIIIICSAVKIPKNWTIRVKIWCNENHTQKLDKLHKFNS